MMALPRRAAGTVAAGVLAALCAAHAAADTAGLATASVTQSESGSDLYAHICRGCHMPEGQGAVGAGHYPKLAGNPALVSWQYVAITVLNGKHAMPAFGRTPSGSDPFIAFISVHLTDEEVANVVNFVRGNFGNHYKERVTTAQVAALPHPGASATPHQ